MKARIHGAIPNMKNLTLLGCMLEATILYQTENPSLGLQKPKLFVVEAHDLVQKVLAVLKK